MRTKGGYVILDLQDANVYAQAKNCLLVNKPVMVYDNAQVYYADSIILDGTNVVLTKGGKTITIANDNTITTSGDIQNHLYVANTIDLSDEFEGEKFLDTEDYIIRYTDFEIYTSLNLGEKILLSDLFNLFEENKVSIRLKGTLLDSDDNIVSILLNVVKIDNALFVSDTEDNTPQINSSYDRELTLTQLF